MTAAVTKDATIADLTARHLASVNRVTELRGRLDIANSRITELEEEVQTAEIIVTNLRLELGQQRIVAHVLAMAQDAGTGGSTGKGPKTFTGNFNDFRSFLLKLQLKTSSWTDEQTKLKYAVNLLSDKA